jgi:hypothetical protein
VKQELAPAGALAGGGGSSSAGGSSTRNLAEADSASGVQCKEDGPSRSGGSTGHSGCGGMVDLVSSGSESEENEVAPALAVVTHSRHTAPVHTPATH